MATQVGSAVQIPGGDFQGDITSGRATEVAKYRVEYTDTTATCLAASLATGVPAYGAQLGSYWLYVTSKKASRREDGRFFDVEVTYSTIDNIQQPPKPSGWTTGDKYGTQITWNSLAYEQDLHVSYDDKVCVNVVDEPMDPPIKRLIFDRSIRVVFWCDLLPQSVIDACLGNTNNASVTLHVGSIDTWTMATNTLRFMNYSCSPSLDPNTGNTVYQITYEFVYKKDGHNEVRPNMSYYNIVAGATVPIKDEQDTPQPVISPRYLDSTGTIIPNGSTATIANGGLISFRPQAEVSFSTLMTGIP